VKRIVLDQGIPATAAPMLREGNWDAIHVREIGMQYAADIEILDYAAREYRVVITLDRDFPQILALTGSSVPSVVLIRQQGLRAADIAHLLATIWVEYESDLDSGCVVKATPRGIRSRRLPLK
jgi:predicted nuclease of predicted toxin-antitoxin system